MTLRKLNNAAASGNPDAQYQLAAMLATGDGCEKDTAAAADWYGKAAAQGHTEAMYNLGLMHLLEELPKSRKDRGQALLEKAAEAGSWDAQWFLAEAFTVGAHGLTKTPKKAAYYAVLALDCRYRNAMLALGTRLQERSIPASALAEALVQVSRRKPKPTKRG